MISNTVSMQMHLRQQPDNLPILADILGDIWQKHGGLFSCRMVSGQSQLKGPYGIAVNT